MFICVYCVPLDSLPTLKRVLKGIFVTRDLPFLFPEKSEMATSFFSRES